ncbi:hypothetical protein BH09PLA1_BH09PLA1_26020 [soil metagenome]
MAEIGADKKPGKTRARSRVRVALKGSYARQLEDRCVERCVSPGEAIHQFMDEARQTTAAAVKGHLVNEVKGKLTEIAMASANLKNRFQRSDGDATARFRIIERALQDIGSLVEAIPGC